MTSHCSEHYNRDPQVRRTPSGRAHYQDITTTINTTTSNTIHQTNASSSSAIAGYPNVSISQPPSARESPVTRQGPSSVQIVTDSPTEALGRGDHPHGQVQHQSRRKSQQQHSAPHPPVTASSQNQPSQSATQENAQPHHRQSPHAHVDRDLSGSREPCDSRDFAREFERASSPSQRDYSHQPHQQHTLKHQRSAEYPYRPRSNSNHHHLSRHSPRSHHQQQQLYESSAPYFQQVGGSAHPRFADEVDYLEKAHDSVYRDQNTTRGAMGSAGAYYDDPMMGAMDSGGRGTHRSRSATGVPLRSYHSMERDQDREFIPIREPRERSLDRSLDSVSARHAAGRRGERGYGADPYQQHDSHHAYRDLEGDPYAAQHASRMGAGVGGVGMAGVGHTYDRGGYGPAGPAGARGGDSFVMELQTRLNELQAQYGTVKRELDATTQKLGSSMHSIKTFWSPELKKERALRKEEAAKYALINDQLKLLRTENQLSEVQYPLEVDDDLYIPSGSPTCPRCSREVRNTVPLGRHLEGLHSYAAYSSLHL
ncbi:hypothetical protein BIW11_01551 [Tropilaelaps mercedesae]|uniref:C2H2-type domain-containing protein n=1 Tax=Tropilaelaps mercedesae TaxID=418985 RepID=A0A1V9XCS7_9ACAR|nr:hypothetical protein BIW11_01551 [Tropilaelaps mercedesae]